MFEKKKIIVLGAGYGGILTAKKLAKKVKKNVHIEVTVIDKNPYHTMLTELHEVAAERVPEDAVRIDLKKVFAGRHVDVVMDEITTIDYDGKKLVGSKETYEYDYLVIGTGSKPTYFGCKGAKENCLSLWSFDDAVRIKNHIREMFRQASKASDPAEKAKLLTFVVVGCGFTGIEMIGELAEWKAQLCKTYTIDESEVTLNVVDIQETVLPLFNDKLIRKTERYLEKKGVTILTSTNITEVTKDHVCLNADTCIDTKTVIWAAGIESSDILETSEIEKKGRNRIVTNDKLQSVDHEDVFVVGDNIFFIPEGEDRPVPQMVENAEHSAKLVAHNICALENENELKTYKPKFHGAMVCIGGRYGVAQIEMGKTNLHFSGFLAMVIKHFINLIYFLQVAGFNKIWTYAMHEVFHVPNRRSLFGGHFSKASSNFWMVPLRLFVGCKWLLEGVAKLGKVFEDPTDIFLLPSKIAVSGASEVVEVVETATLSANANIFESIVFYAERYSTWEWALPVPEFITKMVDWSMDLVFYQPSGEFTSMATIFQTGMVIMEILVGLALIAGLFTMLSSVASIVMGTMIWSSGSAPVEMLWYMFAGVALIAGSGSTFGLDYYVQPWLKKHWKKNKFVKKWYIYTE